MLRLDKRIGVFRHTKLTGMASSFPDGRLLCALEQLKGFLESAATMYGAWRARISAFARRSRSNAAE
jgi:hypothetical protein